MMNVNVSTPKLAAMMMFLSTVSIQSYHSVVKDSIIKTNITLFVVFTLLTVHGPESHRQVVLTDYSVGYEFEGKFFFSISEQS